LSLILKWLESLSIDQTITDRCSRQVSPKSTCTTCIEHCDSEALTLVENKIKLDVNKCDSCGECIIACPTASISGTVPSRTIKNGMLYYEPHFCPTSKELLILRKRGLQRIAIPSEWHDEQWEKVIAETNEVLTALEMTPFVFVKAEAVKEQALTRRELFTTARTRSQSLAKELAPAAWRQNPNAWSLPHYYQDVQFFQVELDFDQCSFCGSCFTLCKQRVFDQSETELSIDNQKCTNCKLCSDACPEGAISVSERLGARTVEVHQVFTGKCKRCKSTFRSFDEDTELCHVCVSLPSDWLMP